MHCSAAAACGIQSRNAPQMTHQVVLTGQFGDKAAVPVCLSLPPLFSNPSKFQTVFKQDGSRTWHFEALNSASVVLQTNFVPLPNLVTSKDVGMQLIPRWMRNPRLNATKSMQGKRGAPHDQQPPSWDVGIPGRHASRAVCAVGLTLLKTCKSCGSTTEVGMMQCTRGNENARGGNACLGA